MTAEDLALRRPVWVAMSDLFLDTDVRLWYCNIARVLAESPYTIAELDGIFRNEVAPVVAGNLLSIAGEWAGFDEAWLVSKITARIEARLRMPSFLPVPERDWEAVTVLVDALRRCESAARPARLGLWTELSKLFLDREKTAAKADGCPQTQLESVWRDEMWPSFGAGVEAYWAHNSKAYPTREEIEEAFAGLRNAVS